MATSWPLIEREHEFASIRNALSGADGGIILTGEAGVGKTTLARHAVTELGLRVRWVAGTESARSIPMGVFAHLVGAGASNDPVSYLSTARESLLADGPVVVGVDDAHLLDTLSATLLHQLAIDRAVRIIATVRSGETVPDAVTSMWKDGHLARITLVPFTKQQSVDLVESVLGGQLEGLSAERMWTASGGNALFLRHLVQGALESGALRQVEGVWQLRGRAGITSELASLLEDRVDRFDDDVLAVLKLLAVCEPLDLDLLSDQTGAEAVEEAEQGGLIRITQDSGSLTVSYAHPLLGEVIRRRLGLASSRRLRGRLVRALSARTALTAAQRIRLAQLALESDEHVDRAVLLRAAQDSLTLADVTGGERFALAALDAGNGLAAADLLARALMWQGKARESDEVLNAFDPAELTQPEVVRWGMQRIGNLFWSVGETEGAARVLEQVRESITEPALEQIADGIGSACAAFENDLPRALTLADRVLNAKNLLPWAEEWAVFGGGLARALGGRGSEVAALAARGRIAEARTDGVLRFPAGYGEILALTLTGRFDDADRAAARYDQLAAAGQYLAWALAGTHVSTVALARGDLPAVTSRLEQSLAALAGQRRVSWVFPARYVLAQAYAGLGQAAEADAVLLAAEDAYGPNVAVCRPQLLLARACQLAAAGAVTPAIAGAREAAHAARDTEQYAVEALALHTAARFGATAPEVVERLAALAARIDGELAPVYARHAAAVAASDGADLDAAARDFERIGALMSAADAAAAAATAHDRAGHRTAMAASSAAAARLSVACGGLRTPAVVAAAQPLPLTVREREIASLVAVGLTNREIADRLVVSVRTVEGHIYRACQKFDVADRAGLADLVTGRSEADGSR
ncbi:LuxR C-terminal-related transcriptional regulator [Gordonia sp. PP30]|uniref:helix-turn-helix transcriptional regulator n=1 Tax=Gordonia sp. PP30 TaxID=2935861 RepID=UPI00200016EA|nr:LuxR family transcriptional regulator [Gordonia sp. PP30]UQE76444.1 LuxR C-terminal-related transcriptional regulator [Gordonia sp. PP30]